MENARRIFHFSQPLQKIWYGASILSCIPYLSARHLREAIREALTVQDQQHPPSNEGIPSRYVLMIIALS